MKITSDELRNLKPIIISVIGPTNEGKTSVLRTLTGDPNFGEINAYTGTTIRAEIQKVFYKRIVELLQLIDTPGFQMSGKILERIWAHKKTNEESLHFNLNDILEAIPFKEEDFLHDYRAWKEIARSDLIIFVVNVAESPDQSLIRDSLILLKHSAKPVIAVFNNVHKQNVIALDQKEIDNNLLLWRKRLQNDGFHLSQIYDAHQRDFQNEFELFEKIAVYLNDPLQIKVLKLEMQERKNREFRRLDLSRKAIAELLVDVACYQECEVNIDKDRLRVSMEELEEKLKKNILIREHKSHQSLLDIWDFRLGILNRQMLTLKDEQAELNHLFGEKVRDHFKLGSSIGAGIGATIGLTLDIALAGLSLGTGTLIGGALGGMLGGSVAGFYNIKYDKKDKKIFIQPEKELITILLSRSVDLVQKLQSRGKALEDGVQILVSADPEIISAPDLYDYIKKNSSFHSLSHIETVYSSKKLLDFTKENVNREEVIETIVEHLRSILPNPEIIFE
ncbi:MAG: DUF3482 domain-containing protein [Planctomycetia bacterium]|nr:DUF3482 domain-containing protein [Planctomycetia bacterium]